jgi:type I restriction enzyme M protein
MNETFSARTKSLIDNLKRTCASYGLGNDGNEFKIVTQAFLYKFLNDKFGKEVKAIDPKLAESENWEKEIATYSDNDFKLLLARLPAGSAKLEPVHFISYLFTNSNDPEFAQLFDDTLRDISLKNSSIFSVETEDKSQIRLFDDELSNYIANKSQRNNFCKAIINQLVEFSFEDMFDEGFDFFSTIFEYMIKDYNKDGGGKYAEYYTPHAVAKIMASILVQDNATNVTCYDPAAGSGTLLMNLAHAIGPDKCTIYSQDISQKSSSLLRLNLILNNLTHSIHNIVQGNTIVKPAHPERRYDYIVSNPPFKLDFSDDQPALSSSSNAERFFAGVPNIPNTKVDSMSIYLLFIQHIIYSLAPNGKAAVVVPTGFITAQSGIEKKIREKLVESRMLQGVISMPSNIFATTGTNVSIIFIDKANAKGDIVLMDASKFGTKVKDGKNQKTLLSNDEEEKIIGNFKSHEAIDDFSVIVNYDEIKDKNYSLSAGQYFDVKIEYTEISADEFTASLAKHKADISEMFEYSKQLENEIVANLDLIKYDK